MERHHHKKEKTLTGTSRHLDRGCSGIVQRLRRSIHSCCRNWGRFNNRCYCCGIECLRGIGISCRSRRHIISWNGIVLWQGVVRPGWRISSVKRERVKLQRMYSNWYSKSALVGPRRKSNVYLAELLGIDDNGKYGRDLTRESLSFCVCDYFDLCRKFPIDITKIQALKEVLFIDKGSFVESRS